MKPKHYITALIALFALAMIAFLTGCTRLERVVGIKMANEDVIEFKAGEFSYDGIKVILTYEDGQTKEYDINEKMISEADKLNFYKMGEHTIRVSYTNSIYTTMKINVVRHEFDDIYELVGYTCVYDGKPHKVDINYELPEGTTIEFPYGNTFTNAGVYTVEASISKTGYVTKKLSTTLTIEKAIIDISGVEFEDQEFVYDGEVKTIEAKNIPQGVRVEYEMWNQDKSVRLNNALNVGTYVVVAKFSSNDENFEQSSTMEATLTITKAKYDMSKVALNNVEKDYDGQDYQAKLADTSVLPEDVAVAFKYYNAEGKEVTSTADAGEYKIVATFTSKNANYEDIAPMEATLKVNKKKVSIDNLVVFNSVTVNFDREVHSLAIEGNLPENVTVAYENNDQRAAGEYKVIARFTDSNKNEILDITELEAYLIINKIVEAPKVKDATTGEVRDFTSADLKLSVEPQTGNKSIEIVGFIEDEYEITSIQYTDQKGNFVKVNDFSDGVQYNYDIVFTFKDADANKSINLSPASGTIKFDITFEDDYRLDDVTVTYDGKPHGLVINKELPVGVSIEYPNGEEFTDAGTYQIKWVISKATYRTLELIGNLKITKATYDMSKVVLEDVTRVMDGLEYIPEDPSSPTYNHAFDNLPTGVTVKEVKKYTKVADAWEESTFTSNVGEYKIVISFNYDEANYEAVSNMEYLLTVTPQTIDLSAIKFNDKTIDAGSVTMVGVAWMGIDDVPFAYEVIELSTIKLQRSENLPEIIGVIYDYKDSNNNIIFSVEVSTNEIYYIPNDYPTTLTFETRDGNTIHVDFSVFNTAGTYNVTARFVLNPGYNPTNYKLSVEELNATLTVK